MMTYMDCDRNYQKQQTILQHFSVFFVFCFLFVFFCRRCECDNVLTFCDDLTDNMVTLIYAESLNDANKLNEFVFGEKKKKIIRTFSKCMHVSN